MSHSERPDPFFSDRKSLHIRLINQPFSSLEVNKKGRIMASNSTYAMKNDFDATTPDKPSTPDAIKAMGKAPEYKLYKRRWIVLCIFVLYSASNSMQWIQYAIIADVIMEYYNTSSFWVDWTSMIFMITYIPLIFPASWMLDKFVSIFLNFILIVISVVYV